jgi:hypothetical protein
MNDRTKNLEYVFGIINYLIYTRQDVDTVCPCLLLVTRLDPY